MADDLPRSRRARPRDDDEDDIPVVRSRRSPGGGLPATLRLVSLIAWIGLLAAVTIGGGLFVLAVVNAGGAPQEAAIGAIFSTAFIGLYIVARCLEKLAVAASKPSP